MDIANYNAQQDNPAYPGDPMAQVRQQILAQMGEPSAAVDPAPTASPSTTSPDYASPTEAPAPAPVYAAPAAPSGANVASPGTGTGGLPNVAAPGNDANQIQGWASQYLGRTFSAADLQALQGQPLELVQHNIANSPEAQAYAARNKAPASGGGTGGGTPQVQVPSSGNAYGIQNGTAVPPQDTSWRDSIRNIVLSRLAQDQTPVDENSPQIVAALNASKDQLTRQNTTERNALAERLYGQGAGLNTDAITQQIQQSNERTGTAQSSLRAQLIMSAYKDRATELNHLLDLATQSGDVQTAQQIQITLANLQAAVQREGLGINVGEFNAQLSQNAALAGLNG